MDYLEIVGTAIGVAYLYLEYKASIWLWIAGIIMPAIYLVVYYRAGLYADFGINVYYLLASFYGLACWLKSSPATDKNKEPELPVRRTPVHLYPRLAVVFLVLFVAIALILIEFTDSDVPWADSFTTALSIVAMWMLAKKYAEQWLVWILIDIVSSGLYVYKSLYFTAALYAVYAVIAIFGYRKWLQLAKTNQCCQSMTSSPKP